MAKSPLEQIATHNRMSLTGYRDAGLTGLEIARRLHEQQLQVKVIILTTFAQDLQLFQTGD